MLSCLSMAILIAAWWAATTWERHQAEPEFVCSYPLAVRPPYLTESLAKDYALMTLTNSFAHTKWTLLEHSSSEAPDGTPDRALMRRDRGANSGTLHYLKAEGRFERMVFVQLSNNTIRCEVWAPKT